MKKLTTLLIFSIIILFSLIVLFSKPKEYSETENRYLEEYPKFTLKNVLDGSYTKKLNNYLSDHFILRDTFMYVKNNVDKLLGKTKINGVYIGKDDYLMMDYNNNYDKDKIVKVLNTFQNKINYINVELMLVPTSLEINKNKLPKYVNTNQLEDLNYIYDKIKFNKIDVYNTLQENNNNYQMFYRLDHHWTTYGAYYAYIEYCKSNNITPIQITDFDIEKLTDTFKGTLYSKVVDSYKKDSIYIFKKNDNYEVDYGNKKTNTLYEKKYLETKDKYSLFLDNNHPLIVINNKNTNDNKEIVIIKDSYANSIIPFISKHFSKIHVIDPRFYKLNISEYIKTNKIKDVLILYNMNSISEDKSILGID